MGRITQRAKVERKMNTGNRHEQIIFHYVDFPTSTIFPFSRKKENSFTGYERSKRVSEALYSVVKVMFKLEMSLS